MKTPFLTKRSKGSYNRNKQEEGRVKKVSTLMMELLILFLLGVWFTCVLYIFLYSIQFTREQNREIELVKSIETYLTQVLEDVEWTDDTVNMVIDSLYDWTRLPKEKKYEKH